MTQGQGRPGASAPQFGALFCRRYLCNSVQYEKKMLRRCLYPHALPFAFFISLFSPGYFHQEQVLIKDLWRARTVAEVQETLDYYQGIRSRRWSGLRLRISSRRVLKVAKKMF
jgi:hypothetical protein